MSESILQEAQRIIHGDRNVAYGHPRDNFAATAAIWNGYVTAMGGRAFSPQDVANMMILFKVARVSSDNWHRDSYVDIAGYAGCAERFQEPVEVPMNVTPEDRLADWERELLGETTTQSDIYEVEGRAFYARWEDVPYGQPVNSSDETDDMSPWYGDSQVRKEGELGEPPWREWIDPDVTVESVPAAWHRLRRVPVGTTVTDKDGDKWKRVRGGVHLWGQDDDAQWGAKLTLAGADLHDIFAPFVEQL